MQVSNRIQLSLLVTDLRGGSDAKVDLGSHLPPLLHSGSTIIPAIPEDPAYSIPDHYRIHSACSLLYHHTVCVASSYLCAEFLIFNPRSLVHAQSLYLCLS